MAKYNNINAELARYGLRVADMAEFMGMTTANIYGKLNGHIAVTQKDMVAIQDFFRVKVGGSFTLDYLFASGK